MDEAGIKKLCDLLQIEIYHKYRKGYVLTNCPMGHLHKHGFDEDGGFAINIKSGQQSRGRCFYCKTSGKLQEIYNRLIERAQIDPNPKVKWVEAQALIDHELDSFSFTATEGMLEGKSIGMEPFPESYLDQFCPLSPDVVKYLKDRNIPGAIAKKYGFRYDMKRKRLVLPVRNMAGVLTGVSGRAVYPHIEPKYYRYLNDGKYNDSSLYNEQHVDFDKPVICTESFFDVYAILPVYDNVVAPLYAHINNWQLQTLRLAPYVITFFDYGDAGDNARKYLRSRLHGVPIRDVFPCAGKGDAGDMTPEEIEGALKIT